MTASTILIVAPTAPEYAVVRSALGKYSGRGKFSLQRCGAGMRQASAFCKTLDARSVNCLVLVGWAGGLSSDLKPGDIVISERVITIGETPVVCTIPAEIQDRLEQVGIGRARIGDVLTNPQILATSEAKQKAQQMNALAVEMEAYPLAAWAQGHDLPFIHARVILDASHESLPDLGESLDKLGRPRILPVLGHILRKPLLLKQTWWLARRIRQLNSRLAALAGALVDVLEASTETT